MSVRYGSIFAAGTVLLGLMAVSADAQTTFTNSNAIQIVDNSTANPYPSVISLGGLSGTITKITVTINQISHGYAADVGAVVVGPNGQAVVLFDGAGGSSSLDGFTWTFDDAAVAALGFQGPLTSGTYKPNTYYPGDNYQSPGPGTTYGTQLSAFNGISASGDFKLFVKDFVPDVSGVIAGGWSVTVTTSSSGSPAGAPGPGSVAVFAAPGAVGLAGLIRRRRRR